MIDKQTKTIESNLKYPKLNNFVTFGDKAIINWKQPYKGNREYMPMYENATTGYL